MNVNWFKDKCPDNQCDAVSSFYVIKVGFEKDIRERPFNLKGVGWGMGFLEINVLLAFDDKMYVSKCDEIKKNCL